MAAVACTVGTLLGCSPTPTAPRLWQDPKIESTFGWVVTGDYPYGQTQVRLLPGVIRQINADPAVDLVFHLGDIKGAGACSTTYYRMIKAAFDQFQDPLIYTFGDNEWTDCSRTDNGSFNPLERLSALRKVFIPKPGYTLGRPMVVTSQVLSGLPENVSFVRDQVSFGTFHAVGSANGLVPWRGHSHPTVEQRAEVQNRSTQAAQLIRQTFTNARQQNCATIALFTQADMFPPGGELTAAPGYQSIVNTLAREAATFQGEVYLFNGDSHAYHTDKPLGSHSDWPAAYKVPPADNLTRVTIEGGTNTAGYLRVTTRPNGSPALTWAPQTLPTQPAIR